MRILATIAAMVSALCAEAVPLGIRTATWRSGRSGPPPEYGRPFSLRSVGGMSARLKLVRSASTYAMPPVSLEMSRDGETWEPYTIDDWFTVPANGEVLFRADESGNATLAYNEDVYHRFIAQDGRVEACGNPSSLLNRDYDKVTDIPDKAFIGLFRGCTALVAASNMLVVADTVNTYGLCRMFMDCTSMKSPPTLSVSAVKSSALAMMFYGCSSLEYAPRIPVNRLEMDDSASCYQNMFCGCASMTNAPALPATEIAYYCYMSMFANCSSLTEAPELPATVLYSGCYEMMFQGCSSLREAPVLRATDLVVQCYANMFKGCTSLREAPNLPAETIAYGCYIGMFQDCTSLTDAPILRSPTVDNRCYAYMFKGCTSLTNAPVIDAEQLGTMCYMAMFADCTSLRNPPRLPSTHLAWNCYNEMFQGCTALEVAPTLPAETLATGCYNYMFDGCSSLREIRLGYGGALSDGSGDSPFSYWVNNVSGPGVLYYSGPSTEHGRSEIPVGWDVAPYAP